MRNVVHTKGVESLFIRLGHSFNASMALAKSYLALIKTIPLNKAPTLCYELNGQMFEGLAYHARSHEISSKEALTVILDEAEASTNFLPLANGLNFLDFMAKENLWLYLTEKIEASPQLVSTYGDRLVSKSLTFPAYEGREEWIFRTGFVEALLREGTNLAQGHGDDTTPWFKFLGYLEKANDREDTDRDYLFEAAKVFIPHTSRSSTKAARSLVGSPISSQRCSETSYWNS